MMIKYNDDINAIYKETYNNISSYGRDHISVRVRTLNFEYEWYILSITNHVMLDLMF